MINGTIGSILPKMYPQDSNYFNSYIATPLESRRELSFYQDRGLIAGGTAGINYVLRLKPKIETGPGLIAAADIRKLFIEMEARSTLSPFFLQEVMERQPNLQNVVSIGCYVESSNITCGMETYEYALMVNGNNGTINNTHLDMMVESARRNERLIRKFARNRKIQNQINFEYTHEEKIENRISKLCEEYHEAMLDHIRSAKSRVSAPVLDRLKSARPESIGMLRMAAYYLPLEEDEHTVLMENSMHFKELFERICLPPELYGWGRKLSGIGILPVKSLDGKPEMEIGQSLYMGNEKELKNGLDFLRKQVPKKTPYGCPVGNVALHVLDRDILDDTMKSCLEEKDKDKKHGLCKNCLERVEDELYRLLETEERSEDNDIARKVAVELKRQFPYLVGKYDIARRDRNRFGDGVQMLRGETSIISFPGSLGYEAGLFEVMPFIHGVDFTTLFDTSCVFGYMKLKDAVRLAECTEAANNDRISLTKMQRIAEGYDPPPS